MKRMMLAGVAGLSCLALMAAVAPAKAMMIAPAPIAQRVAQADCVIVGKVTSLEDKKIPISPGNPTKYTIAVVKIEDGILGVKGLTHVRVAFIEPPPPPAPGVVPPPGPGGRPVFVRPIRRYPQVNLVPGQEACLFLTKAPKATYYLAGAYYNVINKAGNNNFENEVKEAKRCGKLLADPMKNLKSDKNEDRFLTAAMLMSRIRKTGYPNPADRNQKTEPIAAEESKLILQAIADADWSNNNPVMFRMNPSMTFNMLGQKEGWTQPRDYREFPEAAKKWLKDNASTYRIQRVVPPAEKKD